jgi:UDPglucose 6-dehydrogenase
LQFAEDINSTLKDAEIVLHLTEWKIYREINPAEVKSLVKSAIMIDGRNALDRELWQSAGWKFRALGRTHSE